MKLKIVTILVMASLTLLASPAFAEPFARVTFVRAVENGVVWQKTATNPKVVSGITSFKDGSAAPNRLTLFSNYTFTGPPTVGVEPSGEIMLVTKSGTGKTILLRVSAEGEGARVSIEGGPLYVDELSIGNIRLSVNAQGALQLHYKDGRVETIRTRKQK